MAFVFHAKRALVTGAGKGIGKAVTKKLAECGAEVTAVSRTQSDLDELSKYDDKIKPILLDISNWKATQSALENIGPVDFLVNNAGVYKYLLFGDFTEEAIDEVYNINLKAVINISQIVTTGMIQRGTGGSVVNVSSIGSKKAAPTNGIYGSSKAALDQLTRNMADELGPYNIRVNAVNPGPVRTPMTEMLFQEDNEAGKMLKQRTALKRLGEVDDVTYPILFLLSDYASLITGITMTIDGGLSNTY